jgi:hypothetical protein
MGATRSSALNLWVRQNLASNGKLHRAIRETITKARREADRSQAERRATRNAHFLWATNH